MESGREVVQGAAEQRRVRDAYGASLLLVIAATLGLIAAGSPLVSPLAVAAAILQLATLLLTLRVSGFHSRWSSRGSYAAVGLFAATILAVVVIGEPARLVGLVIWMLLTLTTVAAIGRRVVTYDSVNVQLVMGLLVVYILIGIVFGLTYQLFDVVSPPSLTPEGQGISGALYYSFVTLATLGYGDVLPGNNAVRALAVAEALVGQLYLVSVVSLAVSRLGARRFAKLSKESE